jgi:hypothetical protein
MITESLGDVFARGVFVAVAFAMHANIPASLVHPATLSFHLLVERRIPTYVRT